MDKSAQLKICLVLTNKKSENGLMTILTLNFFSTIKAQLHCAIRRVLLRPKHDLTR